MNEMKETVEKLGDGMNEEIEASSGPELEPIKPGTYVCEYVSGEKLSNPSGFFWRHTWKETKSGRKFTELSSDKLSEKSKLWDIFRACGFTPKVGQKYKMGMLVGKRCLVSLDISADGKWNDVKTHAQLPEGMGGVKTPSSSFHQDSDVEAFL